MDEQPARRSLLPALATAAFVAVVCGIALSGQQPPQALPADAPAEVFSSARAMKHVEAIAREPHPLGSAAEEPVRAYLLVELKALGLEPEIQQPRDARPIGPDSEDRPVATRRAEHRRPLARHGTDREEGALALGPL